MTDPAPGGQISVVVGSSALSCHKKIEFPPGESFWKAVGKLFLIEKDVSTWCTTLLKNICYYC